MVNPARKRYRLISVLLAASIAVAGTITVAAAERQRVTVGVLVDGPDSFEGESALLRRVDALLDLVASETVGLIGADFEVTFPESKRISGEWEIERIRAGFERLMADPEVDIVLAAGIFATNEAALHEVLPKPVIAPYAIDIDAQRLPSALNDQSVRTSGRTNLVYITSPGSIERDIARFLDLVRFDRLHILTDGMLLDAIPGVAEHLTARSRATGVEVVPVPANGLANEVLESLPAEVQAVYITPLIRMSSGEFGRLVRGLNERRIPSFSLLGRLDVEQGVFAGLRDVVDQQRVARRIALYIQRILLGEQPSDFPVVMDTPQRLTINLATARRIGVYPSWRTMTEAELLHEEGRRVEQDWTLGDVVREAVRVNLSLGAASREVEAERETIRQARSALRPQVEASVTARRIDEDRAAASFGSAAERSASAGLSLSQLLYSDEVLTGVDVAQHLQRSLEFELEIQRLDIARDAARAFLDVLRVETLERIEKENLRLTESNLDLATRRNEIGYSGPAEVYRWESELARQRSAVISAHNRVESARARLNQLLHRPQEELFSTQGPALDDADLTTGNTRLRPFVDNPTAYRMFRDFTVREGLEKSPELDALDAAIAAQRRLALNARRSLRNPEVALFGELAREFSKDGAGSESALSSMLSIPGQDRETWTVGVQATLPLYTGGRRRSEVRRTSGQLSALELERAALAEQLELRIRTAALTAGASYAAIDLARESAAAASRNLELVQDSYSRGLADILDLLDAQNASLVAGQSASNAVNDFLLDLMEIQRASNGFDFFLTAAERDAWFDRLEAHFAASGVPTR